MWYRYVMKKWIIREFCVLWNVSRSWSLKVIEVFLTHWFVPSTNNLASLASKLIYDSPFRDSLRLCKTEILKKIVSLLFSFFQKRTHMNFKVVGLLGARTARYLLKLLSRYYFAKPPRAHSTVASDGKLIKKTFLTSLRFSFFPKRTHTIYWSD